MSKLKLPNTNFHQMVLIIATIPHVQQVPVKTCKQYTNDLQMLRMWPYPTEAKVPKHLI